MGDYEPIELSDPALECGGLRNLTFYSQALRGRGDVSLWVPPGCEDLRGIPMVILLHGVYGSHWAWFLKGAAHRTARKLIEEGAIRPMVLVSPSDGLRGDGTGYLPGPDADYESWIVRDVSGCVRRILPCTAAGPAFLAGLSMGGYGALRLGLKWPGLFRGISAHSAITCVEQFRQFVREPERLIARPACEVDLLYWAATNRDHLPALRFDCGRSDSLFAANLSLHRELRELGIEHRFEGFDGTHSWDYWRDHLQDTLMFFESQLLPRSLD